MKLLRQLISAVALSILASTAVAQTEETSANLIINPTFSGTSGWTTGGMTGGTASVQGDGYTSALPGYTFSHSAGTIAQTYAINQALSAAGAGIQIHGFDYGFQYQIWCSNQFGSTCTTGTRTDALTYTATITNSLGQAIYSNTQDLTGGLMTSPASIDIQQRFSNPHDITSLGYFSISFSGRDLGGWAGNYGPTIGNVYSRAVYSIDPCVSNPQSNPACPGYKTFYTIADDDHVIIPFPQGFTFPFYGRIFTHSIMFDNGVVSFFDPVINDQRLGGAEWDARPLSNYIGSQFHYSIMPLWGDLAPNDNTKFFTQTDDTSFFRYTWENLQQWGRPDRLNTFSLELRPTGYIGINYEKINLTSDVTVGMVGNALLGEWDQIYYQPFDTETNIYSINNWSVPSTQAYDCSDPHLANQYCGTTTVAYENWQIQQCTVNPISFNGFCETLTPTIWFDYKCSESALYDPNCLGYAAAFLADQCSKNTLYSPSCYGYDEAYAQWEIDECTNDIESFGGNCETITPSLWFDYQCDINALYDEACPLYADAFYVQQCTTDPLYDSGCTGYAEAFAKKYILTAPIAESVTVAVVLEAEETVEITAVSETPATTADPSDTTAPVQLVENTAPTPQPAAAPAPRTETTAAETAPRTTRQALAERRLAAARAQAEQRARENPAAVANEMDTAESMEQQAEIQNVVIGAMGFVPGFDAYSQVTLPDAAFYPPFEIYAGQQNIDTPAARGLLGRSDRLHQEMIDAQYK